MLRHDSTPTDFAGDVLVRPDSAHSRRLSGFDDLIERGYEATKARVPAVRACLAKAGVTSLEPRPRAPRGPRLEGAAIRAVVVEGSGRVSDRLARRTFNIPVGPPYEMARVRAFDKIEATDLFDRTWMEFAPGSDGVDVVLRVNDAAPNRAEVGFGYTEWERAKGSIRLRNQNTLGFGEQVELLVAGSDAERVIEASLRGERLFVTGFGYRVTGYSNRDRPRFFTASGDEINRARFDRGGVDVALRTSLERWGLVEGRGTLRSSQDPGPGRPGYPGGRRPGGSRFRSGRDRHPRRPGLARVRAKVHALRRVEPREPRRRPRILAGHPRSSGVRGVWERGWWRSWTAWPDFRTRSFPSMTGTGWEA